MTMAVGAQSTSHLAHMKPDSSDKYAAGPMALMNRNLGPHPQMSFVPRSKRRSMYASNAAGPSVRTGEVPNGEALVRSQFSGHIIRAPTSTFQLPIDLNDPLYLAPRPRRYW